MCSEYRGLIVRTAEHIPIEDGSLDKLKYLCKDFIGERSLGEIDSPLKLFDELEKRGKLGVDKLGLLREILQRTNFYKLDEQLQEFELGRELQKLSLASQVERQAQAFRLHGNAEDVHETDGKGLETVNIDSKGTPSVKDDKISHQKEGPLSGKSHGACSCFHRHCPERLSGEIHMEIVMELATKGAWLAGTGFILKRYIEEPQTLAGLFATVVLPAGILVKYLCKGSVICVLVVTELPALRSLWQDYKQGLLKEKLEKVLITKELEDRADGDEIILRVEINENAYRDVCIELVSAQKQVTQIKSNLNKQVRSLSDPNLTTLCDRLYEGANSSRILVESFRVTIASERRMRRKLERDNEQLRKSLQPFPINLDILSRFWQKDKKSEDPSDCSSTFTLTSLDEDELLKWEDEDTPSQRFWESVVGGTTEKSWSELEHSIKQVFPDEARLSDGMLLNFLAYVLKADKADPDNSFVPISRFVRLVKWFGPFCLGPKGCLRKMYDLMKGSVSKLDSTGKMTCWFAGYLSDQDARIKLGTEKYSTFLVRFNTERCEFTLTKKSSNGDISDYPIEVDRDNGEVLFGVQRYPDLPSLVNGLCNKGLLELSYPFFSSDPEKTSKVQLPHKVHEDQPSVV